jgi:cob(I)alamin adenosyltransferase
MSKFKIYTKTGDQGETSLVGGQRVAKDVERIELYGDVDELNSHIGLLVAEIGQSISLKKEVADLEWLQSQIFCTGSFLASEPEDREKFKLPKPSSKLIELLESRIDSMGEELSDLKNFILPGGSRSSAQAHICRTVCRRCERKVVRFKKQSSDAFLQEALMFLNRLSDYFFVLGRFVNKKTGGEEKIWKV